MRAYGVKRGTWLGRDHDVHEGMLVSDRGDVLAKATGKSLDELRANLQAETPKGASFMWCRNTRHPGLQRALRILRAKDPESLETKAEDAARFLPDADLA